MKITIDTTPLHDATLLAMNTFSNGGTAIDEATFDSQIVIQYLDSLVRDDQSNQANDVADKIRSSKELLAPSDIAAIKAIVDAKQLTKP